jgi:hypothetical protein
MSVEIAERLVTWMALSKRARGAERPIHFFDGAFPCGLMDGFFMAYAGDADPASAVPRVTHELRVDRDGKVRPAATGDVTYAAEYARPGAAANGLGFELWRLRWPVRARDRAVNIYRSGIPVDASACYFNEAGVYHTHDFLVQRRRRGEWFLVPTTGPATMRVPSLIGEVLEHGFGGGALFLREARYWWSVYLSFEGSPSLRFLADPTGVREVFRLRDAPPGAKRRAALVHWVSEHWRRKPRSDDLAWVQKHLRGQRTFHWNGLRCVIDAPSIAEISGEVEERALTPDEVAERPRLPRGGGGTP